ncbi:MAG: alpha/beta hydrolase [Burkholderiaceae bacterium]|nr:alpha/beta hydrolase [Burkholderiaceae bacterium]
MKPFSSEFITVRGLRYHLRQWGEKGAPLLVMLHGWMDVSASFQFVVDQLKRDWHVIAPDWRGFGLSQNGGSDTYYFADYVGDLDAILAYCSPDAPVNLLGHSMGGNIACLYAGIRPERVTKLINLEGFGMGATKPEQAPQRYAKWLAELREPPRLMSYASEAEVAARLQKNNPRLSADRAAFLAPHWGHQTSAGVWEIRGDPAHKGVSPILYRVEEVLACWRAITAPVLWVEAAETEVWRFYGGKEAARAEIDGRMRHIANLRAEIVADAGHMLHHDQPEVLAGLIEGFLV